MATPDKSNKFGTILVIIGVQLVAVVWISYLYERMTGLTFVLGRGGHIGQLSSADHLSQALRHAVAGTLFGVPLATMGWMVRRAWVA